MTSPIVSVILPTFNRLHYLRSAIESVFAQTFADWELIIADDGSEEGTRNYLASLASDHRIKIIRLPHTGNPGATRNCALRAAQGRFVAFLDSDDMWLPRKLELQIAAHRADPSRRWSYTAVARIDKFGRLLADDPARYWVPHEGAILEQLLTLAAVVATPSVVADRHLIETAGGFDEDQLFFEEYDLWLRLIALSEVAVVDEPLVMVRSHDEHYTSDRVGVYEARSRLLDKVRIRATSARLRFVLRMERAKNQAHLAAAHAASGNLPATTRALWHSRHWAWRSAGWWRAAGKTLGQATRAAMVSRFHTPPPAP